MNMCETDNACAHTLYETDCQNEPLEYNLIWTDFASDRLVMNIIKSGRFVFQGSCFELLMCETSENVTLTANHRSTALDRENYCKCISELR